jgi:hypothetical protein
MLVYQKAYKEIDHFPSRQIPLEFFCIKNPPCDSSNALKAFELFAGGFYPEFIPCAQRRRE